MAKNNTLSTTPLSEKKNLPTYQSVLAVVMLLLFLWEQRQQLFEKFQVLTILQPR